MKTVPLFEVISLTQDTDRGAKITDALIQDQVARGLEALERALLDDFARAQGNFSADSRQGWRQGFDAQGIRERIHYYMRDHTRGF